METYFSNTVRDATVLSKIWRQQLIDRMNGILLFRVRLSRFCIVPFSLSMIYAFTVVSRATTYGVYSHASIKESESESQVI